MLELQTNRNKCVKISFLLCGRTPLSFEGKQACSLVLKTMWVSLPVQPWHFTEQSARTM